MKSLFLTTLAFCCSFFSYAQQNLILNPSFENIRRCPIDFNQIGLAYFWSGIDTTKHVDSLGLYVEYATNYLADLITTCGVAATRCPNNWKFYQYPRTGNTMVQSIQYFNFFYFYSFTGNDTFYQQNYVQGRLSTPLTAGTNYCVTFYVSMEDYFSAIAVGHIGAYLDDGTIDTTTNPNRPLPMFTPQVVDTNIISDTMNWVKIQGSFTAVGNEKFITLGVFRDTGLLRKLVIDPLGLYSAYLIDDVSVIESNATAYAGRDTAILAGDTVSLGQAYGGEGMPCWWYQLGGGAAAIDSGGTLRAHPTTTTSYVIKMDLCGRVTYDTVTVTVWPLGEHPHNYLNRYVQVSPNPVIDQLTISNAANTNITIIDMVGKPVMAFPATTDNETINVSTLSKGIYLISITDPQSGEKVVRKVVK